MLLPIKAKNPPESIPFATIGLIFINVVAYFATTHLGLIVREDVVENWAFKSADFPSITLLTSMFLHAEPMHLIGNMFFLYLFGFAVEGRLRTLKFLALYFGAGFAGDLVHHFIVGLQDPTIPSLGASGAIMGVLGAAMYVFPHSKVNMFYWFGWFWYGVAEWSMWVVGIYYLSFDLLYAMLGLDLGVANFAHLGGALGGFLIALAMRIKRDDAHTSEAKSNLSDMQNLFALRVFEVEQIAKADPANSQASLAWVWSHLHSGRQPTEESLAHLEKHLPTLVRTGSVRELADVLGEFAGRAGRYHARYAIDVALRAEREAEAQSAMRLLEAATLNPHLAANDREIALYQLAMVHEAWFQNYGAATHLYSQVMQEFAGSPMADQAAARYKIVSPRAGQSGSHNY